MNHDPLLVVNPKVECRTCSEVKTGILASCGVCGKNPKPCPVCEKRIEQEKGECKECGGTGSRAVDLCGLWAPSAAFLVCGGPSLNKLPYDRLGEKGVASLAVNNVAGYTKVSAWVFSDPQSKFHHGLFLDPKILTFAPLGKLKRKVRAKLPDGTFRDVRTRVRDCPGTLGFSRRTEFDASTFLTTRFAHWGRGGKQEENNRPFMCLCTMLLGIRLLHYLGCPRVYMLGVDFLMTDDAQYSFGQTAGVKNGRYAKENAMLAELKPVFDKEGFQLFNCNQESGCDVFPKVNFEQAFEDCKGGVPEEPFDLTEWYSKKILKRDQEKFPNQISVGKLMEVQKSSKNKESE